MTQRSVKTRICQLLDAIKADFPRRKRDAENYMSQFGPYDSLEMIINEPEPFESVPTFSKETSRAPSDMFRARFEYAGTCDTGWYLWLAPADMSKWMRKKSVREHHEALRGHYEGSAPNLFNDQQLTLFGVTAGVPDILIYLVWKDDNEEPEIWSYDSYDFHRFPDLEKYLEWYLNRP